MKANNFKILLLTACILALSTSVFGSGFASLNDCLIQSDIGKYNFETQNARMGRGSGVIGMTGHFNKDHTDTVCTAEYSNISEIRGLPIQDAEEKIISIDVQVTQHSSGDSDKWLLHEMEIAFQKNRTLGASYAAPNPLREINGNKIFFMWGHYKWISNNVVLAIDFTDLSGTKPEPLDIVQAYLQKFPSTISSSLVLDDAHKIGWIKDEMERRLWLCDKWFSQLQLKKVEEKQAYKESVKSMSVFLDYREKYYGIKASDEKYLLTSYQNTSNGTKIKAKLAEYKDWWTANKEKGINL